MEQAELSCPRGGDQPQSRLKERACRTLRTGQRHGNFLARTIISQFQGLFYTVLGVVYQEGLPGMGWRLLSDHCVL